MKYWSKSGHLKPLPGTFSGEPELRVALPKRDLEQPIPGVSKPPRGRRVPKKGAEAAANRKHICPVQVCGKAFTKRDHLNRHIKSLHQHEQSHMCPVPECDKTFTRFDNYIRHMHKHQTLREEIIACSPEDGFKGVHVLNPLVDDPEVSNIKPFANIAIPPLALNLWLFRERMRMNGADLPDFGDCAKYFREHPDERESALRGDPKWQWAMPPLAPSSPPSTRAA
ncbi:hypothetical protein C8Q80DRAFT_1091160 [Daedaleopsis nitida]|nr:hypothetical protein C8Q80DRAFT_1091160 [Daedaleopsis nitida]